MDHTDEVADGGAGALEAGPRVLAALTHRRGEDGIEPWPIGARGGAGRLQARHGGHGGNGRGEVGQLDLDPGPVLPDDDLPLHAMLLVDGARHADRLVSGSEVQVATDLLRDLATQRAEPRQVVALGRLGEPPPGVQLGGALGSAAAALDQQGRPPEVVDQVRQLGGDVAGIEIDHHGLHLQHVLGAGLALLGDGAGDDIDGAAFARGPGGIRAERCGGVPIGRHPDIVRLGVEALALVDEAADRDQPVAIAERYVEEGGDLLDVRRDGPSGRRHRLPSTGQSIEGDLPSGGNVADFLLQQRCGIVEVAPCGHAGCAQQRLAQEQKRHSK